MCGIAGVWGRGDAVRMAAALKHRGPDDEGAVTLGRVQLASRRLAVIDIEGGHQPMVNEGGTVAVSFNGVIFNYKELKHTLEQDGFRFRTQCDTEVVLRAFEAWGPDCVDRFNGMFAIAIATPDRLMLVRDRLGEKPLYYVDEGDRFLFASEIKGFVPEVRLTPRFDSDYWCMEAPTSPQTMFSNVHELPPGHRLFHDGQQTTLERYWRLPRDQVCEMDPEEAIRTLRDLLDDAVRLRMRANVPIGVYLSGGLDSALIAALMKPEIAYACRFPLGDVFDESHYARQAAEATGSQLVVVEPEAEDFRRRLPAVMFHLDQPVATASPFAEFMLAERAVQDVTVVVGGQGADELFGGYTRYLLMLEEDRLWRSETLTNYRPLMRHFWSSRMGDDPADRFWTLTRRGAGGERARRLLQQAFEDHSSLVSKMGAADLVLTLPSLIQMNDRSAAAHGLENRTPFLDHRIVEFAFSLPDDLKVRNGQPKWILREVARGLVPDAIVDRPEKKGLVVPAARWLNGELSQWRDTLLGSLQRRGVRVPSEDSRGEFGRRTYAAVCLELWLQQFAPDYQAPEPS